MIDQFVFIRNEIDLMIDQFVFIRNEIDLMIDQFVFIRNKIDLMTDQFVFIRNEIDLMIDQFVFIRNEIEKDVCQICLDDIWPHICIDLLPFFKSAGEIVLQNEYQGIKLKDKKGQEERAIRGRSEPLTATEEMKKLVNFSTRYMAALRDNLMSHFDCKTMKMCRKFPLVLDPMPYFYSNNDFSNGEDPRHGID